MPSVTWSSPCHSLWQHNRFVLDCKDKEPDVLFVGDSMVQLLQQYEVGMEGGREGWSNWSISL